MKANLFEEFSDVTKEAWTQQAIKDLNGKDFNETLISHSLDGIRILPFYTGEDLQDTGGIEAYHHRINSKPPIPGMPPRIWHNVYLVAPQEEGKANLALLDSLQQGSDALMLQLNGEENLDLLLKGVSPQYIQIFLLPVVDGMKVLQLFLTWVAKNGFDKETIQGGLLWDSFGACLKHKNDRNRVTYRAKQILELGLELTNFKTICIDTAIYHNAGATEVQELSFAFAAFIDLLDDLTEEGTSAQTIFDNTFVRTAVGSNYFMEISKLRAIRTLLHQLSVLYEVSLPSESCFLFAETSFWTKSKIDMETNLLRNTTEAMAAILGGCNALYVCNHDLSDHLESGKFAERMARNISSILKEESFFDKVIDPVAGSFYIENLIVELLSQVKDKLVEIEIIGGWWVDYQIGKIQKEVKEMRLNRMEAVKGLKNIKVGANKYKTGEGFQLSHDNFPKEAYWELFPSRETLLIEHSNPTAL